MQQEFGAVTLLPTPPRSILATVPPAESTNGGDAYMVFECAEGGDLRKHIDDGVMEKAPSRAWKDKHLKVWDGIVWGLHWLLWVGRVLVCVVADSRGSTADKNCSFSQSFVTSQRHLEDSSRKGNMKTRGSTPRLKCANLLPET